MTIKQLTFHKPGGFAFGPLCFLAGIIIGFLVHDHFSSSKSSSTEHYEIRADGYNFIRPLLDCESEKKAQENQELEPFEKKIEQIITNSFSSGMTSHSSVYFRDLNNGPWFSVNPEDSFAPASLLKVPFMMAILKQAELNPDLLNSSLTYDGTGKNHNAIQNFRPSKTLVAGEAYTIDQLLNRMIAYSDNNASALLEDYFSPSIMRSLYRIIGLAGPFPDNSKNLMPVEGYARFFRVLFNASYLNREMSEKALGYIAKMDFKDGLRSALPSNITVAHKFGEQLNLEDNTRQLHECGIVYYPAHPYLLCVMTKGSSFEDLDETIMKISHVVYESVDRQH